MKGFFQKVPCAGSKYSSEEWVFFYNSYVQEYLTKNLDIQPCFPAQCREMLRNTSCFHENDMLFDDRGFLSQEMTNYLKIIRKVDTYLPAKKNMIIYQDAVKLAFTNRKWQKHSNWKRKDRDFQLAAESSPLWESNEPKEDVPMYV